MPGLDDASAPGAPPADGLPGALPASIDQTGTADGATTTPGYKMVPLVALGGSAGSIPVLQKFFAAMSPSSGMAFVVILHLARDTHSALAPLLARCTPMRVAQVQDGEKLEPDRVYIIPPGKYISTVFGTLRLHDLEPEKGKRVVIDIFFRALADSHGPQAAAVILSGAAADGSIGIKRIKERGGLTIVQDPDEAEHPSMPKAAIATGMIDWVLPAEQIPARLLRYSENRKRLRLPPENDSSISPAVPSTDEGEVALREILSLLRTRTGRDFSYYKRATVVRRIARRLQINGLHDLPAYAEFLRTHPGEAGALLQDLLISVTNFFRDRESFEALERVIPDLFRGKGSHDTVRAWVPACATGEEAYSIAMLLFEHARTIESPPIIQVFAGDLNDAAIQAARYGIYPETIAADVSEERLQRFFVKEFGGMRVRRELREAVLFAEHDLLKDPPFSRMDLISCRNLLIYLNRDAQGRALDMFHFALRQDGVLFLGTSEAVDEASQLFDLRDKKHRIYVHKSAPRPTLPLLSGPVRTPRPTLLAELPGRYRRAFLSSPESTLPAPEPSAPDERASLAQLHLFLIERFTPPSILLGPDNRIVHISENAGRFLQFLGGEPTTDILSVINPALRLPLRAALFQASDSQREVEVPGNTVMLEGNPCEVAIRVSPAHDLAPGFLLVVLNSRSLPAIPPDAPEQIALNPSATHLDREIEHLSARLRRLIQQHEADTEELRASNEELQAMNEELRSTTEELETSSEELQSSNEELGTLNHELKAKIDELAEANSDLNNLMASSAIATVFVDRGLRVMRYTPSAVGVLNFIPADMGRPLKELRWSLVYPQLISDAEKVLQTLMPVEREVCDRQGQCYLARLLVYRSEDDRIGGVVLTFVDITRRVRAEEALRQSEERLRMIMENSREFAIFSMDLTRRVTTWNKGAESLLQFRDAEIIGHLADIIFTEEDQAAGAPEDEARRALADDRAEDERWHARKDRTRFWGSGYLMTMRDAAGKITGFVKILHDRTEAKAAEEALAESRKKLESALYEAGQAREEAEAAARTKDQFLATLSHELRTPLTPVLLTAEGLLRRNELSPRVREGLEMICRNVQVQTHLIDDLLDVTRIVRGKLQLRQERFNLHDCLRAAIQISESDFWAKQQNLSVDLQTGEVEITGDACRMQQVFWNLLKNASKFTPEGGRIRVSSHIRSEWVEVSVSDNGEGIDPALLPNIFEAFRQGDSSVLHQHGGLGLGLAIARASVEAHGGTILSKSQGVGRGSTFTVKLPLSTITPGRGQNPNSDAIQ